MLAVTWSQPKTTRFGSYENNDVDGDDDNWFDGGRSLITITIKTRLIWKIQNGEKKKNKEENYLNNK